MTMNKQPHTKDEGRPDEHELRTAEGATPDESPKPETLSTFWAVVLTLIFGGALLYGLLWSISTHLIEPLMRAFR